MLMNMMIRRSFSSKPVVDWSSLFTKLAGNSAATGELGRLRASFEARSSAVKAAQKAPVSIDWNMYAKTIETPGIVDALKAQFDATKYSIAAPTVDNSLYESTVKDIEAIQARAIKQEKSLKEKLAILEANRTTYETTVDDVLRLNPQIAKEIEEEHKRLDYGKSVVY